MGSTAEKLLSPPKKGREKKRSLKRYEFLHKPW
jgi:hypothetical protein